MRAHTGENKKVPWPILVALFAAHLKWVKVRTRWGCIQRIIKGSLASGYPLVFLLPPPPVVCRLVHSLAPLELAERPPGWSEWNLEGEWSCIQRRMKGSSVSVAPFVASASCVPRSYVSSAWPHRHSRNIFSWRNHVHIYRMGSNYVNNRFIQYVLDSCASPFVHLNPISWCFNGTL
jgi:hypothetical protein